MNVVAILPVYTHVHERLRSTIKRLGLECIIVYGSSDLPKARSALVSAALRTPADRIIFLDADMAPKPDALAALIEDPAIDEAHAVSALYATRSAERWAMQLHDPPLPAEGAYQPAVAAGLGCAVVDRRSLELVSAGLPTTGTDGVVWQPFCVPLVLDAPGGGFTYIPEDYALWWRLGRAGTSLLVRTDLIVGHMAETEIRSNPPP